MRLGSNNPRYWDDITEHVQGACLFVFVREHSSGGEHIDRFRTFHLLAGILGSEKGVNDWSSGVLELTNMIFVG